MTAQKPGTQLISAATLSRRDRVTGWRKLCILFVLALLLFLPLRWQPEAWLRGQMIAAAGRYGMTLDYRQMETAGLTVHLRNVRISGGSISSSLSFDSIRLAPAWMSLLQAKPAARVTLIWQGIRATATVLQDGQVIVLNGVQAGADASSLAALAKRKQAVQVAGRLLLTGDIRLDAVSGHPLSGALNCRWQQAAASFLGKPDLLGDYVLSIRNKDTKKLWQWTLGGGTGVVVKGRGTLATRTNLPQQWFANGHIELSGGHTTPVFLKVLLHQPMHFRLAGPLAMLRLQPA